MTQKNMEIERISKKEKEWERMEKIFSNGKRKIWKWSNQILPRMLEPCSSRCWSEFKQEISGNGIVNSLFTSYLYSPRVNIV